MLQDVVSIMMENYSSSCGWDLLIEMIDVWALLYLSYILTYCKRSFKVERIQLINFLKPVPNILKPAPNVSTVSFENQALKNTRFYRPHPQWFRHEYTCKLVTKAFSFVFEDFLQRQFKNQVFSAKTNVYPYAVLISYILSL